MGKPVLRGRPRTVGSVEALRKAHPVRLNGVTQVAKSVSEPRLRKFYEGGSAYCPEPVKNATQGA
jgi:hypothetical protein